MAKLIYSYPLPKGKFDVYDDKPDIENLIHVHQVHSSDIEEYQGDDISHIQADGIIVSLDKLHSNHFAIKTADCIPAIFIGNRGICIIHAGWMGVRDKILIHPNISKIDPYFCLLGPSIHQKNFQVQEDFYQHFEDGPNYREMNDKLCFDLHSEAISQIKGMFPSIEIINSNECTYESKKYNSYRRDKTTQRNWNIFSI